MPPDFQFSQASLQDYESCARRFKLRYLDRLRWPAIESEPVYEAEQLAKLGTDFHHLVRQHLDFQQLPFEQQATETALNTMLKGEHHAQLRTWWESYLQYRPDILSHATLYPEVTFSTPLRGYRLTARFDLLAVEPNGRFTIIDWKTSQRKPKRERLAHRVQTHVYPYVLAQSGAALHNGNPIPPEAINLMYWYPASPLEPERFPYNTALHERDEAYLSNLVEQVKQSTLANNFPLVDDPRPCQYCIYRSLCDRGDKAGPLLDMEEEADSILEPDSLDWEQVAEVMF